MENADSRTLSPQFYWQRGLSDAIAEIDLLTNPESSCWLYGARGHSLSLFTGTYEDNGEPVYKTIASGDVFTLISNNPKTVPLPSRPLLETLQW
ncbi:hypothetical protein BDV28DRAFT_129151 [Aspergillus coremiiformis]|uniref:Uncharacterized protein n=1 Tax=Aspergillus coremiiformis TaxID=138285 RepID=A0A5N6ZCG7_9EURO|nr:hypothetical protein BDV28DRAFT_129151 [Aspergillus coremiiformis]